MSAMEYSYVFLIRTGLDQELVMYKSLRITPKTCDVRMQVASSQHGSLVAKMPPVIV